MKLILESVQYPKLTFEVLSYDKETKIAQLLGQGGTKFTRTLTPEVMKKYGYRRVMIDDEGNRREIDPPSAGN